VVNGHKPLENRRWATRFRGEFIVHASKGMTVDEYEDARSFALDVMGNDAFFESNFPHLDELAGLRGGIVGRARLVNVVPPCDEPSLFPKPCSHRWHMGGQYGFELEDIVALPFAALKGELGFFGNFDRLGNRVSP
jgi:hypothetical protein